MVEVVSCDCIGFHFWRSSNNSLQLRTRLSAFSVYRTLSNVLRTYVSVRDDPFIGDWWARYKIRTCSVCGTTFWKVSIPAGLRIWISRLLIGESVTGFHARIAAIRQHLPHFYSSTSFFFISGGSKSSFLIVQSLSSSFPRIGSNWISCSPRASSYISATGKFSTRYV